MNKRSPINNLLVGPRWIENRIEYKQAVLRGQLSLLLGVVSVFYLIIDPLNGIITYVPIYIGGLITAFLVIYLNRLRRFISSSLFLILICNAMVFTVADASSPSSGVYFFFVVMALVALVLFYHTHLKIGISLVIFSVLLGITAYFNENSFLEQTLLTGINKQLNFTINLILGVFTSVMVILFVIRRNNESEASLIRSKQRLEKLTYELTNKNEELQKANTELDRFVYSASHDIRAPLSTLTGLINIAKISNDPSEHKEYLNLMTSRINDMEGFISDVTDYSRNARLEVEHSRVNLKEVLGNLKESFDFMASEAGVEVKLELDNCQDIKTDETRLKIILNNILANAINHHDQQKASRFVKVWSEHDNGLCKIIIEDNGLGIDGAHQDKIFNMFYRASENSKGSGLGLYIVKETLAKLNGAIEFKSEPLKGSKFTIKLPRVQLL